MSLSPSIDTADCAERARRRMVNHDTMAAINAAPTMPPMMPLAMRLVFVLPSGFEDEFDASEDDVDASEDDVV